MKQKRLSNPVIPDYTSKAEKKVEPKLDLEPCCVCHKPVEGYFCWVSEKDGVCSNTCWIKHKATRTSLIDYIIPKGTSCSTTE